MAAEIQRRALIGERGVDLAAEFGISCPNVTKCKQGWRPKFGPKLGKTWKEV